MNSGFPLAPAVASAFARQVDGLTLFLVGVTAFFTIGIAAALFVFAVKYRRRPDAPPSRPANTHGRMAAILEITWIVIPFILVMIIFVWGAMLYLWAFRPPADAMTVYVVGKQWMWKIQHPNGVREINELHVPQGRAVKLLMTSEDVIHNFSLPALRVKMDVVPGRYTSLWFRATEPGDYRIFCSQYCGTNHSYMTGTLTVLPPDEYEKWLSSGGAPREALSTGGDAVFQKLGCATCHDVAPGMASVSGRGPNLSGVFGQPVRLVDGRTVTADEGYIRESILFPQKKITEGYGGLLMPSFQGQVNEDDLLKLISYIKSLGSEAKTRSQ